MGDLSGKVAFVTGAAGSIGRAIAARFAEEGAAIFMVDVAEEIHAEAAGITAAGGQAAGAVLDLRSGAEITRTVEAAMSRYGRIDVLVNGAAIFPVGTLIEMDEDVFKDAFDVNFFAAYRLCRAIAPHMVAQKTGAIVNVVSGAAFWGARTLSAYAASKAALVSLTKVLAAELAPMVRVNALSPGVTERPPRGVEPGSQEDFAARPTPINLDRIPMKRIGKASEIADAALFLASDRSSFITGETLIVDGGALMR